MKQERTGTWITVAGVLAILSIPVLMVGVVLIGARGGNDGSGHAVATSTSTKLTRTSGANGLVGDKFAKLEAGGAIRTMVEQHQGMMDQMRVNATPQMLDLMSNDPMWRMMRSGEYVRLLEGHEANLDRMLARGN